MGQSSTAVLADGALDLVITNAVIIDHSGILKADIGIRGNRIVGNRQSRQSGHHGRRHARHDRRRGHGSNRGRRKNRHGGRHRRARPFHLPATDHDRAFRRPHHADRRRHRPCHRHRRHYLHARRVEHAPHARSGRGLPRESRLSWQGKFLESPRRSTNKSKRARSG